MFFISKLKSIAISFLLILGITSCKTTSDIVYFQDLPQQLLLEGQITDANVYTRYIRPDDLLGITVSGTNPMAVAPFNLPSVTFLSTGESKISSVASLQTYLVNSEGYINFPVLGELKVAGLTKAECIKMLQEKISQYATDPIVNIQILNFKISVLGEVTSPGSFTVDNDRVSVLDAIGLAKDLTIYGDRTNVILIREDGGEKKYHKIDLTKSDIFNMPYYYLQQNDVVYVQPNKYRQKNSRYSQKDSYSISVISVIVSSVSVVATLIIALVR